MEAESNVSDLLREQVTPSAVDALRSIEDAGERAQAALEATDAASDLRGAIARVRRDALLELSEGGMTWAQIGALLGTSGARAHQIAHGRTR